MDRQAGRPALGIAGRNPAGRDPGMQSAADGAPAPALEMAGLGVRYPGRRIPALDGVEMAVRTGELVGVTGRNGAGKSTLALAASGFIPRVVRAAVSGSVRVAGRETRDASLADLLGQVGIVFSTPSSQLSGSKLTVREELAFGLENLGVPRSEMDERIERTLAELGIRQLADRLPTALSGGEQQRVAIASILCMGPGALVLDEPVAQLDPAGTVAVADLLLERAASGTAILVAEHRHAVLARAARVALLDAGRLVADMAPWQALGPLIAEPAGVEVPTVLRIAEAVGLEPALAFDEEALAIALGRARSRVRVAGAPPGHAPAEPAVAWEPVRAQPPTGLELTGLVHRYPGGVVALAGVDLVIEPGETVAVVGQNGSGKTTLVRHLVGILAPTEGTVRVGGADIAGRPIAEVARTVGFVFQDPDRQLFSRSVELEVAFGPRNLGLEPGVIRRLVDEALGLTGLDDRRAVNPHDLTVSDRKLVALASILAMDPALLALDEPTTGQDGPGVARVGSIVDAMAATGRTVVAITHDMEFAACYFGRIVVMRQGRIVADGPLAAVFAPANAALLASTGLELPPVARLAGRLGLGAPAPLTVEELLTRVSLARGGESAPAAPDERADS